jgi:hypothetical protein
MFARLLILLALAATLFVPAGQSAPSAAPDGLRAFLLRADEPFRDTFSRTPSFAWAPYENAKSYDFELATSKDFDESTIIWSTSGRTKPLQVPAVAIQIALPWMTGNPYALYAHVRARTASGLTRWSVPFGFNMRWKTAPEKVLPDIAGLVRWKPIEGATSYEVWFIDAGQVDKVGKVITTSTNVADEREFYSFHPDPTWTGVVQWRVRAVRNVYGALPNGLPAVTYGPWSQTFVSTNPTVSTGPMSLIQTVSNVTSTDASPAAHSLTPAFSYTGDTATNGLTGRLFRVYIATDRQCVNIVFTGAVVGSPAYAPRTSGPLLLPTSSQTLKNAEAGYLVDGGEANTYSAGSRPVTTTELGSATATTGGSSTTTGGSGTSTTTTIPTEFTSTTGAHVDLWDSGWPTGRYYWTVVPVREEFTNDSLRYFDAEPPQDACAAGRVVEFGKVSQPTTTSGSKPYASGLAPSGELVAARTATPSFYRAALIAWAPALGATAYEVQWSKTTYPWRSVGAPVYTAATSTLLEGLTPGVWYYRVRGIDPYVPGPVKQMTWSAPVQVTIAKTKIFVQDPSVTTKPAKK